MQDHFSASSPSRWEPDVSAELIALLLYHQHELAFYLERLDDLARKISRADASQRCEFVTQVTSLCERLARHAAMGGGLIPDVLRDPAGPRAALRAAAAREPTAAVGLAVRALLGVLGAALARERVMLATALRGGARARRAKRSAPSLAQPDQTASAKAPHL